MRYQNHPALSEDAKIGLTGICKGLKLENPRDLYTVIYYVEMNLAPQDGKLFTDTFKNADLVLQKPNRKNKTDYK